jgi:ABC-type branched-subunit amino acid transport system substrate-binding protein
MVLRSGLTHLAFLILDALILVSLDACTNPVESCLDPLGCLVIPAGNPFHIGSIAVNAGSNLVVGNEVETELESAVRAEPVVLGHALYLEHIDTDCSDEFTRQAVIDFSIEPDLLIVFGPPCPQEYLFISQILENAGIDYIPLGPSTASTDIQLVISTLRDSTVMQGDNLFISRSRLKHSLLGLIPTGQ